MGFSNVNTPKIEKIVVDPSIIVDQPEESPLESEFKFTSDFLFYEVVVYGSRDLKTMDNAQLLRMRDSLEMQSKMLVEDAVDYAFSGNSESHPDYEKALICGKKALGMIDNAIAYQDGGFD